MDPYQLVTIARIGQGQFGVVDVVRKLSDPEARLYAVKTVQKAKLRRAGKAVDFLLEKEIHQLASTSYHTSSHPSPPLPPIPFLFSSFQTSTSLSLALSYHPCGTLWDLFISTSTATSPPRLSQLDLEWYIPQLVLALRWTHTVANVAHRDVKAQNCLVGERGRLVLSDFGSAARLMHDDDDDDDDDAVRSQRHRNPPRQRHRSLSSSLDDPWRKPRYIPLFDCQLPHGTADYIAPEVLTTYETFLLSCAEAGPASSGRDGGRGYDASVDWWSAGAMTYELAYGVAPFWAEDVGVTYERIGDSQRWLKFPPSEMTDSFRDLLASWLSPAKRRLGRFGPGDVMRHPWFRSTDWEAIASGQCPSNINPPVATDLGSAGTSFDLSSPHVDWSEVNGWSLNCSTDTSMSSGRGDGGEELGDGAGESTFIGRSRKEKSASRSLMTCERGDKKKTSEGLDVNGNMPHQDRWIHFDWVLPLPAWSTPSLPQGLRPDHPINGRDLRTPSRSLLSTHTPYLSHTAPRTVLRTASRPAHVVEGSTARRGLSDRKALKVLMTCVKESARKRMSGGGGRVKEEGASTAKKTLRQRLEDARDEHEREKSRSRSSSGLGRSASGSCGSGGCGDSGTKAGRHYHRCHQSHPHRHGLSGSSSGKMEHPPHTSTGSSTSSIVSSIHIDRPPSLTAASSATSTASSSSDTDLPSPSSDCSTWEDDDDGGPTNLDTVIRRYDRLCHRLSAMETIHRGLEDRWTVMVSRWD